MNTPPPETAPAGMHAAIEDLSGHPFATALDVVGDRWILLILREAFQGITRFDHLQRRIGAPRSTLTSRLRSMVEEGVLYRNPYQSLPRRYEYRLTGKGLDLYPAAVAAWRWEIRWSSGEPIPPRLRHTLCGSIELPELRCESCATTVTAWDCDLKSGVPRSISPPARPQRRSKPSRPGSGVDTSFFHVVDIVGDRWTALVFSAVLLGQRRYDELQQRLNIATNILADRLRLLTDAGVLARARYSQRPERYEYRLTEKGMDLFAFVVVLSQWAERWLEPDIRQPLTLHHRSCGKTLHAAMACAHCGERLRPNEVELA
ncbi:MAG: helix-turn-helix domain-containing protein [Gammaproteobacteria bacterium]|nr:helix-turn-helix domain-containing protein [Gammaproteobacteria bacterium]